MSKFKIYLLLLSLLALSSLSYFIKVEFFNNSSSTAISQQSNNQEAENKKRQEQWKKLQGEGDAVPGAGENILDDKF